MLPREAPVIPADRCGTAAGPPRARLSLTLATIVVVAGVSMRLALYVRNPSVWHDEAALLVNVVDKTFWQPGHIGTWLERHDFNRVSVYMVRAG